MTFSKPFLKSSTMGVTPGILRPVKRKPYIPRNHLGNNGTHKRVASERFHNWRNNYKRPDRNSQTFKQRRHYLNLDRRNTFLRYKTSLPMGCSQIGYKPLLNFHIKDYKPVTLISKQNKLHVHNLNQIGLID